MIELTVASYRGVNQATVALNRVAIVAGLNGQGKTSFAQAASAALTGVFAPGMALKKTEATALVYRGATTESMSKASFDEGTGTMRWPSCEYATSGNVPAVSYFAAGVSKLPLLDEKERARVLADYLQTMPTKEELREALAESVQAKADDKSTWQAIDGVVDAVLKSDYETVEKKLKEGATKAKGAWENITKRRYGSKVAQEWLPEGFSLLDLTSKNADQLNDEITALNVKASQAIAAQAVDASNLMALDASADKLDELVKQESAQQEKVSSASQALIDHASSKPAQPMKKGQPPLDCPCCHNDLEMVDGKLRQFVGGPTDDEIAAQTETMRIWQEAHTRLTSEYDNQKDVLRGIQQDIKSSENSKREADSIRAKINSIPASQQEASNPDKIRADIDFARRQIAAIEQYQQATKLASSAILNASAADVLSPDGIRKKKLASALQYINEMLANIAKVAGWQPVSITDELAVRYGAFPYALCSESEKYRANIMLQFAMASMDASPVIVIDAADILDAKGKNGLFSLINADSKRHFLVCMTASSPEKVPDLNRSGIGTTYWIEAGKVKAIGVKSNDGQ